MKRPNNSQSAQSEKRCKIEDNNADQYLLQSSPVLNRNEPDLRTLFRRLCSEENNSPQLKRESSLREHAAKSKNEKEVKVVQKSRKITKPDEIQEVDKEKINIAMDE